jgi:cytochrome P450
MSALIDDAFLHNPYPAYHALRAAGPMHWRTEFFGGAWVLSRHDDVEAALRDPRLSAQRTGGWVMGTVAEEENGTRSELSAFQRLFARAMLFLDAPDHPRLRQVMNAGFRPSVIAALQPKVEAMAAALLDGLEAQAQAGEPIDFMAGFARPLPAQVIAELMGLSGHDEQADFIAWSDDLADFIGAPAPTLAQARQAQTSLLAMSAWFARELPARARSGGDDLLSLLAVGQANGQVHGGAELLAQCAMLLFAGHETTRNLLGNGLHTLLSHPGQWARLVADPSLVPGAVRELLRYECPVQYTGRRVAQTFDWHGHTLQRGELVVMLIGAANRDPARFPAPDTFDITRRHGASLAFGHGPHVCIGASLTLMEAETALRVLLRRWPAMHLAEPAAQWTGNPVYRGLAQLPVCMAR